MVGVSSSLLCEQQPKNGLALASGPAQPLRFVMEDGAGDAAFEAAPRTVIEISDLPAIELVADLRQLRVARCSNPVRQNFSHPCEPGQNRACPTCG
jgi:hypothetical protein